MNLTSSAQISVDEDGIPFVDYGKKDGFVVGVQRNPLSISTKSIEYYIRYRHCPNEQDKRHFFNCISWLETNKITKEGYSLWPYLFDLPEFGAKAPWYSAMAQARIMVAFERAYELSGNVQYIESARQALESLKIPVADGGVLFIDPENDGKWYEEVAVTNPSASFSFILNGHIFVLLDLNDYFLHTGSQEAQSLLIDGVNELKDHIDEYDTGRWTYYDRLGHLAYDYHYIHIDQMQQLFEITSDTVFKEYHDKWSSYFPINPMWARKRFAAYLFDLSIIFAAFLFGFFVNKLIHKYQTRKVLKTNR